MVRRQIQFTEDEIRALRRAATERGVSVSAVVREAVDACLGHPAGGVSGEERMERAIAAVGSSASGIPDLATRHDDYYADSIE